MITEFCVFNQNQNLFMKSIKFVFLKTMTLLFIIFTHELSFSQSPAENQVKAEVASKVQFIGIENDYLVFEARFSELPAKGCTLQIMDENGNPIYEELINANPFMRRYKLMKDTLTRISFKAVGRGFAFTQSFIIKTEQKLIVTAE